MIVKAGIISQFHIISRKKALDRKKEILLIDIQYVGSINWIKTLSSFSHVKIDICDTWRKGGWGNRTRIIGANGPGYLTVPLLGGRDQQGLISTVKISYKDNWVEQHIRTLQSGYRRAPFYEYYSNSICEVLRSRPEHLVDLNLRLLALFQAWLFPATELSTTLPDESNPTPLVVDLRYLDRRQSMPPPHSLPEYRQVFDERHGFISGVSILDLLFCCGPAAKTLLKDSN